MSMSSKPDEVGAQVSKHLARFYAVASQFEMCRMKMIEIQGLCKNICRIFYYKHLTALCLDTAECVSQFAVDGILQMHLLQSGVLWHLLVFLFEYDFTLEEGGVQTENEHSKQAISNELAKAALMACARLAGVVEDPELATPQNPVIEDCLKSMLTPYVVYKMRTCHKDRGQEVLKLLTSNTKNPYIIWDNSTRAELDDFVENERTSSVRRGTCDPNFGAEFKFSAHKDELVVGNIFVKIYNEMPEFVLEEPKRFAVDLLEFLNGEAQYLYSLMSMAQVTMATMDRLKKSEMALEALANVMKHNKGVDIQCIGHFKLIFFLLRLETCPKVQEMALNVLNSVTGNIDCINDIAASGVFVNLLLPLYTLATEQQVTALNTVQSLMGDTRLVKECIHFNGLQCLLYIFGCHQDEEVRKASCEVMAKMTTDKLMGPKVRILIAKYIPDIFLDAMKNSAETCLRMYENCHENPELIWNEVSRKTLGDHLNRISQR